MHLSFWHVVVLGLVVLVLFGKGKVSNLMGEFGRGITAFKKGVADGAAELDKAAGETAKDVTPAERDKV